MDPPFRADHVGSLLRTPAIHAARTDHRTGTLDAPELREIEDRNVMTHDEQWAELRHCVEVADAVWT
jgi:methionine synthase II (cobalamin-independent)